MGVDWRLDYHIKSSITGNDNEPVYYVTFQAVDGQGHSQDIRVACSLEELQDLHAKFKDAAKQVGDRCRRPSGFEKCGMSGGDGQREAGWIRVRS